MEWLDVCLFEVIDVRLGQRVSSLNVRIIVFFSLYAMVWTDKGVYENVACSAWQSPNVMRKMEAFFCPVVLDPIKAVMLDCGRSPRNALGLKACDSSPVTCSASVYACNFAISTREYMLQGLDTKALGN